MKWELALLAVVLLITMLPSAGVFRWSFRWLPLLHLVLALVAAEALAEFRFAPPWMWLCPLLVFGSLLGAYFFLPTNTGVPKYPFPASLTNAQPLDPARLYLSVYPPPETVDVARNHPGSVGEVTRPGSTPMWAGLRFVNGYSPIRGAGVGTAWAFYTHGEIDLGMASYLLGWKAGPNELLATLGVDGIIVARGLSLVPKPASEWKLVFENNEGRVYNRVGKALPRIRVINLPNEKSGPATIRLLEDSRQEVRAEVAVPGDGASAAILFSRPFFDGYVATLNGKKIAVESYRGLAPLVRLPPGAHGHLTMTYRPWWLTGGGTAAIVSLAIFLVGSGGAIFRPRAQ